MWDEEEEGRNPMTEGPKQQGQPGVTGGEADVAARPSVPGAAFGLNPKALTLQ